MTARPATRSLLLFAVLLLVSIKIRAVAEEAALRVVLPTRSVQLPVRYVRIAALSFDSLLADFYWIRFVQDTPLQPADEPTGRKLANELLSAEALDPAFRPIYAHGPVLLSVLGNQHCAALHVSERGAVRFPDDWRFPFNAGYICFSELGDYACASKRMRLAASIPGSPGWLPGLVARFMAATSQRQAAADYLEQQLRNEKLDDRLRQRFKERLQDARFSVAQEALERALREWRRTHAGALPDSLARLVEAGLVLSIPDPDPYGGHFGLDPQGGVVSSTGKKGLEVFRRQGELIGTLGERLLEQRVVARENEVLGKPCWLWGLSDRIASRFVDSAVQSLSCAARWTADPDALDDLRILEARVMMHRDLDRLQERRIELLRADPGHPPSLDTLLSAASVRPEDPFGSRWRLDEDGEPLPATSRQPMVAASEGGCGSDCDVTPCR